MAKRSMILVLLLLLACMLLVGCLPGNDKYTEDKPAGFLSGIWHGWVAPISLIGGIFNSNIRVYEVANSGWWYDFGFYAAIISGFGGLSLKRCKH